MTQTNKNNARNELIITRIFDAPPDIVWQYWTDSESLKKWGGPKDFTCPVSIIDFREGGKFLHSMQSPDSRIFWSTGIYKEIIPMERIVSTDSFADEYGNVVPGSYYGLSEDFPLEMQIVLTFEEQEGKTQMILRHIGLPAGEMSEMTQTGWNESFDKLDEILVKEESL